MVFMNSAFRVGSYENVPHEGIWVVKVMKKMSSIVEICEGVVVKKFGMEKEGLWMIGVNSAKYLSMNLFEVRVRDSIGLV
jgi:hypothetical protein